MPDKNIYCLNNVIFIPGKNPKPEPSLHREMLWRALCEGVRRASPEAANELAQQAECFHLAAWNQAFYQSLKDGNRDLPWIDALVNTHGPSPLDIREARSLHRQISRLLYNLADWFQFLIRLMPETVTAIIQETRRYFENRDNIGYHVREIVKKEIRACLREDTRLLVIGHSLGSVIAYDTFWELSRIENRPEKIDFLSLGSPLGLNYVRRRLQGHEYDNSRKYPANIRHWYNVAATGDVTAVDRHFRDDFKSMLRLGLVDSIEDHCDGIYNFFRNEKGLNCHRSYGYLVNPAVGRIIADWLQQSGRQNKS